MVDRHPQGTQWPGLELLSYELGQAGKNTRVKMGGGNDPEVKYLYKDSDRMQHFHKLWGPPHKDPHSTIHAAQTG